MKALILAAGYGTRLYPLIVDTPKSLLEVAGKPIINHILEKIGDCPELNEVYVVTNQKFHQAFLDWAQEQKKFSFKITVVNDGTTTPEDRLGSVGDTDFVINNCSFQEDLLVVGGDNIFDFNMKDFYGFVNKKKPHVSVGVYDIGGQKDARQFGVVDLDQDGKIKSFWEKPEKPATSLIAMCCYFFPAETLGCIREYITSSQKTDKAGDYIRWLVQSKGVFGFKFEGKWYDIGSIEAYHEAQNDFQNNNG